MIDPVRGEPGGRLSLSRAWLPLALLGAALLAVPALRYRLDLVTCAERPLPLAGAGYGAIYAAAVALLTLGWVGCVRRFARDPAGDQRIGAVLGQGALVHALALWGPPFLSQDPLFYAAIGRVVGTFHHRASEPLYHVLPAGDPFLTRLPLAWQEGNSAYGAGWNALAGWVARLAGEDLGRHLRLYQLLGSAAMLLCAALTGWAVRRLRQSADPADPAREVPTLNGGAAAALVLLCPLAVIDGTQSAHNDSLLAVASALALWLYSRGASGPALLALACGALVKASALLPLGFLCLVVLLCHPRLRPLLLQKRAVMLSAALLLPLGIVAVVLLRQRLPQLRAASALLGSPQATIEYCTRSVECLPRAVLRFVLDAPYLAWLVGLVFRVLAGLWLLRCALRGAESARPLRAAAAALFIYYLYLHGWSQTWYLLPLLPLLPFASARVALVAQVFCVSSAAYYALVLPLDCVQTPIVVGLADLVEALVEIAPPTVVLLRSRR